jgi:uncharacterized membrane protein YgcG
MTWPSDPAALCALYAAGYVVTFDNCRDYKVIQTVPANGDGGRTLYYDLKTLELVAVVKYLNLDRTCVGGPSDFTEPDPWCDRQPDASSQSTTCGGAGGASTGGASAGGASGGSVSAGGASGSAP